MLWSLLFIGALGLFSWGMGRLYAQHYDNRGWTPSAIILFIAAMAIGQYHFPRFRLEKLLHDMEYHGDGDQGDNQIPNGDVLLPGWEAIGHDGSGKTIYLHTATNEVRGIPDDNETAHDAGSHAVSTGGNRVRRLVSCPVGRRSCDSPVLLRLREQIRVASAQPAELE